MQFKTRSIGKTKLQVTELGLGTAAVAGNHRAVSIDDHRQTLDTGLQNGVSYVDTAPFYGFGRSEHLAGDALRDRDGWVLSTKAGRLLKPGHAPIDEAVDWPGAFPFKPVYDYSYDGVMRSFEMSLQRLGLDRIDMLLLHDIGEMQHGASANATHFKSAMSGGYKALDELRRAGDVSAIGLGVNEREVCLESLKYGDWDMFLLAGRYTLLEQDPLADLLPACEKAGASIVIGGPFNSGILAGGDTWNYALAPESVRQKVAGIKAICNDYNVPLAAAALQFPLGHKSVSSVIPGPRSPSEMNTIIEWFSLEIPPALWRDLAAAGLINENAPLPD